MEYSFPLGFAGTVLPPAGVTTDAHLAYLNSKSALIDEALESLDKISDGNFTITLSATETSLLDTKVDFADVCLLRAGLRLAKAALHLGNSYNVSGEYRKLYDLYAAGNLTPQAVLAAFPQLFNLSTTPARRSDARSQIQLAHAEWNKALAAIETKRPVSEGSVLGPIGYNDSTPFLFAFDTIEAAKEVDVLFDTLVTSLNSQVTFPTVANEDFTLEGYTLNLSSLVTSPSGPRALAPNRFDRGFFRPSSWPDVTLGGIFPGATQDDMNDAGNFLFVLQPTVYEPYQFWLLAGTPDEPGYFEDGQVLFNEINGIAVDSNGNIFVADSGNHVIRKISIDNKVTTVAGQQWRVWSERQALEKNYTGYPSRYPSILDYEIGPITVDGNGTVYFMNGSLLSKLTSDGKLSNLAGSFSWSWQDPKDGFGSEAVFNGDWYRWSMAVDKNGNIYICDANAIRKISPAGQVTTLAGKLGWDDSEGYVDGAGTVARFNDPTGVAVDDSGVVYVMDSDNFVIRKIQPNGTTSTFVGNAKISNHFDAKGTKARLNRPEGLSIDSSGNLYFADGGTIRKVKPDGTVTTIAGKLNPEHGAFRLRGQMGLQEAAGEAAVFGEEDITGLAVDRRGTLYASFENSIYEAESISAPPSGTPFPTPTPSSTPSTKPTPTPNPDPAPTPQILSLTLSTTSVDLTNGAIDLPFIITASEKISYASVYFGGFSGSVNAWPHSRKDNGTINIPSFIKEGTYNLSSLYYSWGSYPNSQSANLYGDSIPEAFKDISITVINPFSDITPPEVRSVKILNPEVNVSNSSAKVRYRVQIEDDLSGFNYLFLNYRKADSNGYSHVSNLHDWNASPVAVDGNRNTYEGTIEVPQGSAEGDWIFESISVSDKAGNSNFLNLTLEPPTVKFTVNNSAVSPVLPTVSSDQGAPELGALSFSKTSVNVSDSSQEVVITANFKDDLTGVKYSNFVLTSPSGNQTIWGDFEEVSGTKNDGIYEASVIIPRYSESGNWRFEYLSVEDEAGQKALYSDNTGPDYIGHKSFPGSISQKTISVVSSLVDAAGPELNALSVSTSSVNVSSGSQELTITVKWSDALSGVEYSGIELRSPSGNQTVWCDLEKVSGTAKDGIYEATVEIPRYAEAGEWNLDLWSRDKTGNAGNYSNFTGPYYIGYNLFPATISQNKISVASSLVDTSGPELTSVSVSKSSLIVSTDSQEIVVTANWKDELSGVQSCGFKFTSPSGNQTISGQLNKVSGTTNNGTYQGNVVIPPRVEDGEWNLELWAYDELGNSRYYSESSNWPGNTPFPENISETKIAVSLAIDPQKNNYAPWPVDLTLDKTSVDVSSGDQTVKVRIHMNNDDLPTQIYSSVSFHRNNSRHWDNGNYLYGSDFKLVSGTIANGIYEGTLQVPRYTKNGNYTLSSIYISESNYNGSNDQKIFNRGGDSIATEFPITITVTGLQDVTAPLLQSIAVSPTSADTRNGTVLVTANLTITDDLSGLQEEDWSQASALALRSPSGKEFLWSVFTLGDRISGNSTNGTYQVQFELPQYSEEGAWTIDYIELVDRNYNTRFLIPANLTAQQIAASTIQVQGWPRGWETLSSNQQNAVNQTKAVITKQSAKFWFPIANIDGDWTWGTGEDDSWEYDWSVEILGSPKYWLSFAKLKKPNETAQSGNFTEFLTSGQVNVWEDSADGGTIIESAAISASRNGTCLLIELTDAAVLSKLQKSMPSYLPFLSFDPSSGSYDIKNVKVEYVKEDVQLSLGNLTHIVDGTDKIPSVTTTPGNHAQDVTITYNGTTSPPSEVGTYTVVAFLNTANYQGRKVATMTISKPIQTIAAFSAISEKVFGAAPFAVTAPTSSSGLPVTLSVKSGPATISANNTVTLTGAGTVVLAANQAGNENYSAASEATTQFNVSNPPPPPAPAASGGGGGGAPSGGGGGGEPEKPKKGKKGSDNKGNDKKDNAKKSSDKKDNNDKKSSSKKSDKKSSSGGDSNKSEGKKSSGKKGRK
ncbi:MAG: MBG domain-containing protein [Verrucomicrobia bacterium]|nr:MBG domain-containing protein [Verrucomicrobiota bacterium]